MKSKWTLLLVGVSVVMSGAATRKILFEESTDVDCGPCPGAAIYLDSLHHQFGSKIIPVAFHYDDAMASPTSYGYMAHWRSGYPNFNLDRTVPRGLTDYQADSSKRYSAMVDSVNARLAVPSPLALTIEKTWDAATRKVVGKVKIAFDQNVTASDLRVGLLLIQDTVVGPKDGSAAAAHADGLGARYMQKNYYGDSSWTNASWVGGVLQPGATKQADGLIKPEPILYPLKAMTWPIMGYKHRHVFRASLLGPADSAWGKSGVIPANPKSGSAYEAAFSYTLPAQFDGYNGLATQTFSANTGVVANPAQMKLVAFVSSAGRANILNAEEVDLLAAQTTAVKTADIQSWQGGAFVHALAGQLQVMDLSGKVLLSKDLGAGQSYDWSGLAAGAYHVRFVPVRTSGAQAQIWSVQVR